VCGRQCWCASGRRAAPGRVGERSGRGVSTGPPRPAQGASGGRGGPTGPPRAGRRTSAGRTA
jgi:hypothetical protein